MKASMHEAKSQLSKLVKLVNLGEEVILTRGRNRVPVAKIVVVESSPPVGEITTLPEFKDGKRPLGIFKGEFEVNSDFFEPLSEEELALWEAPLVSTWSSHSPDLDEQK